jgi:hypothetical protein
MAISFVPSAPSFFRVAVRKTDEVRRIGHNKVHGTVGNPRITSIQFENESDMAALL